MSNNEDVDECLTQQVEDLTMARPMTSQFMIGFIQRQLRARSRITYSSLLQKPRNDLQMRKARQKLLSTTNPFTSFCRFFSVEKSAIDDDQHFDEDQIRKHLSKEDEKMFNQLLEYKRLHGDCHVPSGKSSYASFERFRLGVSPELAEWVRRHRTSYRYNQRENRAILEAMQIKIVMLESLGFMWSDREAQWQRNFNRLEKYALDNDGSHEVDKNSDPQLAAWIIKQRKDFQQGKMHQTRADLLDDLGFVFNLRDAKWWENYEKIVVYKEQFGDTMVPAEYDDDPKLGYWVSRQRQRKQAGLEQDRIQALNDIGFSWDVLSDTWDKKYADLCKFFKKNGHTRVPTSSPLWSWVNRQRTILRQLSQEENESGDAVEKIAKLNEMDFDWNENEGTAGEDSKPIDQTNMSRARKLLELPFQAAVYDDTWVKHFEDLCDFQSKHGHFAIPNSGPHSELSNWIRHQRYLFKRDKLPEERIAALDRIDFAWTAHTARWDRLFGELVRFRAENGHARVPAKITELYRWTLQQRRVLKAKEGDPEYQLLPDDREDRILELERLLFERKEL